MARSILRILCTSLVLINGWNIFVLSRAWTAVSLPWSFSGRQLLYLSVSVSTVAVLVLPVLVSWTLGVRWLGWRRLVTVYNLLLLWGCVHWREEQLISAAPVRLPTASPSVSVAKPKPKNSAPNRYAVIDAHALKAPSRVESNVFSLAAYLSQPAQNDEEKIRAIYRWVTDRIAYDSEALATGQLPDPSVDVTLARRRAVCGGYANLVDSLGRAAGVHTEVVDGYATGVSADPAEESNHAWNAVELNGRWQLLDATWGAGHLDERGQFQKKFSNHYFLTRPDHMLVSHLPSQERWQLLDKPISRNEFLSRPKRMPGFFSYGLGVDQLVGELQADPRTTVGLRAKPDLHVMATLVDGRGDEVAHATLVERDGDRIIVNALPRAAGKYVLRLFAGPRQQQSGEMVLEYRVDARSGDPEGLPRTYPNFQQHSGHIYSPTQGRLTATTHRFEIEVPSAQGVYVNDFEHPLQLQGDRWVGDVLVGDGECTVYANFGGDTAQSIVTYNAAK